MNFTKCYFGLFLYIIIKTTNAIPNAFAGRKKCVA